MILLDISVNKIPWFALYNPFTPHKSLLDSRAIDFAVGGEIDETFLKSEKMVNLPQTLL